MKRRSFLKSSGLAAGASLTVPAIASDNTAINEKNYYELRIYHISEGANNRDLLLNYYKNALIPFLSEKGVKVMVFDEYNQKEVVKIYTLIAYPSSDVYINTQQNIYGDKGYLNDAKSYNEINPDSPVYERYETFFLEAFDRWPSIVMPTPDKKAFELRIYESSNEDFGRRKIMMFNDEEIDLFLETGLEPVFFGRILAGQYMPALIYMVGLPNVESRDATWDKFGSSEGWANMRTEPKYANLISNIQQIFLIPINL